jgi:hypothetical protein
MQAMASSIRGSSAEHFLAPELALDSDATHEVAGVFDATREVAGVFDATCEVAGVSDATREVAEVSGASGRALTAADLPACAEW